ncbi:MAG: copper homeostasis protein CutC [Acidobacteriota bacterium]
MLIEVIACSVEDAVEAERGGAGRLEIARDMERQGLTPPVELVREIANAVRIPLRVMVRENDGYACRSEDELNAMQRAARGFAGIDRVEGLVLGFVRGTEIDHDTVAAVLAAAPRLRATFHRAFDALPDPLRAILELEKHPQIDRVLSGGEPGGWDERCDRLSKLAVLAQPGIVILPGGGVDLDAIRHISGTNGLTEAHVGRAVRVPKEVWGRVSAPLVRELRNATKPFPPPLV